MKREILTPCPYCGIKPRFGFLKKIVNYHGKSVQRLRLSCKNEECSHKPFMIGQDIMLVSRDDAEADLAKKWNDSYGRY